MTVRILLADTCIVSDFYKADDSFFVRLIGKSVEVGIVSPVVEELGVVFPALADLSGALSAGLRIFDPNPDEYLKLRIGTPVSEYDQLSMLVAKRLGFTLSTNDVRLRRVCKQYGVPVLWGLETLLLLCREEVIGKKYAETIARSIRQTNPGHITQSILEDFLSKLDGLSSK